MVTSKEDTTVLNQLFYETRDADSKQKTPVLIDIITEANTCVERLLDFIQEVGYSPIDRGESDSEDIVIRPEFSFLGLNHMDDDEASDTHTFTITMKKCSEVKLVRIICYGATKHELQNIAARIYESCALAIEKIVVLNDTTKHSTVIIRRSRVGH